MPFFDMLKPKHDPQYLETAKSGFRSVIYHWAASGEFWSGYASASGTAFTGRDGRSAIVAQPPGFAGSGVSGLETAVSSPQPHLVMVSDCKKVFAADAAWISANVLNQLSSNATKCMS